MGGRRPTHANGRHYYHDITIRGYLGERHSCHVMGEVNNEIPEMRCAEPSRRCDLMEKGIEKIR